MAAGTFDTSWMWHPSFREDSASTAGHFVHFRKNLNIVGEPPESLQIEITADTRYKLYINSRQVSFGPVKGDNNLWFYDEVDISPYLHPGNNQIGIHVLRFFSGTSYATSFPRLEAGGVRVATVVNDTLWSPQIQSSTLWETAIDSFTKLRIDQSEDDFLHIYEEASLFDAEGAISLHWVPAILLRRIDRIVMPGEAPPFMSFWARWRAYDQPSLDGKRCSLLHGSAYIALWRQ
ncbi:Major facilitator superfamily domain general substrate transporter [Penicillium freii]|uniref:Bacterial alpha-L-rhamnosidase N-terminal domain-containing protein n=1 Tax=Penicillium freii TaxID=48697 RepID=A0A101MHU7_PENFR|nr:Major facilitator superfamily domain general substrate transporter [Penicillium freii]KUM60810.1 hypothetical protein ACN42_g6315 [Penicillium freii]